MCQPDKSQQHHNPLGNDGALFLLADGVDVYHDLDQVELKLLVHQLKGTANHFSCTQTTHVNFRAQFGNLGDVSVPAAKAGIYTISQAMEFLFQDKIIVW